MTLDIANAGDPRIGATQTTFSPARRAPIERPRPPDAATTDLPPPPRPRWLPTWRLAIVVVLIGVIELVLTFVAVLPRSGWILLAFDAALVGLLVVDASVMAPSREIVGSRHRPKMLSIRIFETVVIDVSNLSRRRIHGRLRLPYPANVEVVSDTATLDIGPGKTAHVSFEIRGLRRGIHEMAPLELRVPTRSRLLIRRYHVCPPDRVTVCPNLRNAKQWELNVRLRRREETGSRSSRVLGIGTDFESLREYRPDDDVRQIDWHATARHGTPISRQYRVESNQLVLLVVDTGRLMAAPIGDVSRLDVALDAATAMAYVCSSLGDRVGLLAFDDKIRTQIKPARSRRETLLVAMSELEPRRVESDYDLAFAVTASMKRAMVFLFTDLLETSASAPLLAATPTLTRKHVVVAASVLDPDIEHAATDVPSDKAEAFRQAVTWDVQRQRRAVKTRLKKQGVSVVEAPADRFSLGLIDQYLRIKSRARL